MTDDDKALDKIIRASMPLDFERKETLSDDKALVERLRDRKLMANTDPWLRADDLCVEAADRIEAQAAEIERLREAGQKLNDYACHDDDCQIVTHGVWSDPIPCDCGYEDAWKAWAALGETE